MFSPHVPVHTKQQWTSLPLFFESWYVHQHAGFDIFYLHVKAPFREALLSPFLPFPVSSDFLLLSPLASNSRNMCMFSLYWLCLSCSSLSPACMHTNTHQGALKWKRPPALYLPYIIHPPQAQQHRMNKHGTNLTVRVAVRSAWKV